MAFVMALLAFVGVMVFLSTVVAVIVEGYASARGLRAKSLQAVLEKFYLEAVVPRRPGGVKLPATKAAAHAFANDVLGARKSTDQRTSHSIHIKKFDQLVTRQLIEQIARTKAGEGLLLESDKRLRAQLHALAYEYDRHRDAAQASFARTVKSISVWVAILLAITFNIDAMRIFRALSTNPQTQAAILELVDNNQALVERAEQLYTAPNIQEAQSQNDPDKVLATIQDSAAQLETTIEQLGTINLPIGMSQYPICARYSPILGDVNETNPNFDPRCAVVWARTGQLEAAKPHIHEHCRQSLGEDLKLRFDSSNTPTSQPGDDASATAANKQARAEQAQTRQQAVETMRSTLQIIERVFPPALTIADTPATDLRPASDAPQMGAKRGAPTATEPASTSTPQNQNTQPAPIPPRIEGIFQNISAGDCHTLAAANAITPRATPQDKLAMQWQARLDWAKLISWAIAILVSGGMIGLGTPFWANVYRRMAMLVPVVGAASRIAGAGQRPATAADGSPKTNGRRDDPEINDPDELVFALRTAAGQSPPPLENRTSATGSNPSDPPIQNQTPAGQNVGKGSTERVGDAADTPVTQTRTGGFRRLRG